MKEKCFIPLYESVEPIKKLIDMLWDYIAEETEEEYNMKRSRVKNYFDMLDRKMLNSVHIVMAIGKDGWAIDAPFENPEKEFEEYAEWLRLEENMPLGKESHVSYLIAKGPLKRFLKDGLYYLGVA